MPRKMRAPEPEQMRIEYLPLSAIRPAERNPKNHLTDRLEAAITSVGYVDPLIMDERTGRLVAGHGRLDTLAGMHRDGLAPPDRIRVGDDGEWLVPVVRGVAFRDDASAESYLIGSNQLVMSGGWVDEQLAPMLDELRGLGELAGTGLSEDEVQKLVAAATGANGTPRSEPKPPKPSPVPADAKVEIIQGDCVEVLKGMDDASVDAIVTDPPYGLEFMGKDWDAPWKQKGDVVEDPASVGGFQDGAGGNPYSRSRVRIGIGTGFQEWCETWTRELFRVLKPGGHLLAFGGTRTYHRMACAIEDAGFEIRDSLHWVYGSGFSKSWNFATQFEGTWCACPVGANSLPSDHGRRACCQRCGGLSPFYKGTGSGLKPAHEPIVLARKPLSGTIADNVLAHGTGGINVDGCRVASTGGPTRRGPSPRLSPQGAFTTGHSVESIDAGRWPPNLTFSHSPDCTEDTCAEGCAVAELDRQSGQSSSPTSVTRGARRAGEFLTEMGRQENVPCHGDSGGASRFFPCFKYVAKPARSEREAGLGEQPTATAEELTGRKAGSAGLVMSDERGERANPYAGTSGQVPRANTHATVKPVALMRWLVRLVTPPEGRVLDPFAGSGTTGIAAALEGFEFVGIEREPEYVQIAKARLNRYQTSGEFDDG